MNLSCNFSLALWRRERQQHVELQPASILEFNVPASNRLVAVRIGGSGVNMRCQAARRVLAEVDVDLRGSAFNVFSGQ